MVFLELLILFLIYIILRNINRLDRLYNFWLILAIVISGTVQALHGFLQLLDYAPSNNSNFKLTGGFSNPGPYGGFLSITWCIAIGIYLFKDKINEQIKNKILFYLIDKITLISLVLIAVLLLPLGSRSTLLTIILGSVILLEKRFSLFNTFSNKSLFFKTICLSILSLLTFLFCLFLYYLKKPSADGRFLIWKICYRIFKENMITGIGFDKFKSCYMLYQAEYFKLLNENHDFYLADNIPFAFNDWLQFITENGLIGLLIIIAIIYFIKKIEIEHDFLFFKHILVAVLGAISCFAFFSYPTYILPIKLVVIIVIAILSNYNYKQEIIALSFKSNAKLFKLILTIATLTTCFFGLYFIRNLDLEFRVWEVGKKDYERDNFHSSIVEYNDAYDGLKHNGKFLMDYGIVLSLIKRNRQAIEILKQSKKHINSPSIELALANSYRNLSNFEKAKNHYTNGYYMNPSKFYPLYLLFKLFKENEKIEEAARVAKIILEKKIKVNSSAIREIKNEASYYIENKKAKKKQLNN